MSKTIRKKLSDYQLDTRNINQGSEYGTHLLRKSLQEVGLGRSVVADKNGKLIAGNKTAEMCAELGFEEVIEVTTNGRQLVVVRRQDLDIDSEQGIKAKILDNTVSRHNYIEDATIAEALCEEYNIEKADYGLITVTHEDEEDELPDNVRTTFKIEVSCTDGNDMEKTYNRLIEMGLDCRILSKSIG